MRSMTRSPYLDKTMRSVMTHNITWFCVFVPVFNFKIPLSVVVLNAGKLYWQQNFCDVSVSWKKVRILESAPPILTLLTMIIFDM